MNTSSVGGGYKSKRRALLKSETLRQNEKKIRSEEQDQTTDFIEYLEFLVDYFKQLERLDAGGRKLMSVFQEKEHFKHLSLRNWLINLDIWGTFLPLNVQCYDI